MSVVNIMGSRSGRRSVVHGQSREGATSDSTGLPKRPHTFPQDHDPPRTSIALSSRKKPRFDTITHDTCSNHIVLDLDEHSQREQSSSQLPDDFLEPLPPDESLAVKTSSICMVPSFAVGQTGIGKGVRQVCRQFWKAGDYTGNRSDHRFVAGGMDHVRVHPKFLHSNATSHKWALGAVAELLDNAFDEVVSGATAVSIDMLRNPRNGEPMLIIEDDGGGMDPDSMRHCMSLGYSVKSKIANTIGQYGNGFKTSTMRLGADVIVFSRCSRHGRGSPTESIGLLSYTFLKDTGQDDIIVPIVDYEMQPFGLRKLMRGSVGDWNKNMETITQWSPYSTEAQLLDQFKGLSRQGTRVVVYNLWEDEQGLLELDFMTSDDDIQITGVNRDEKNIKMAEKFPNCRHYLTYRHSLRSYASILYLRLPSQFKIFLRGKEVQHHSLSEDLMLTEEVTYKPQRRVEHAQLDAGEMKAVVTIGFVKDAKEHLDVQGFSVYHKNRLIKPFWRIWNTPDSRGRGIIGVLEANFVEPAHDKQGFERTIVLARLETRLIEMQKSYWNKHYYKVGYVNKNLKKNDKLIPRSDCPATDDLGIEACNDALSSAQDLEVQSGQPLDDLLTHDQVEFLLSPARLEWETRSLPASVEITGTKDLEVQGGASVAPVSTHSQVEFLSLTMPEWESHGLPASAEMTASKVRSEPYQTGQMLQDLATTRSLTHMQSVQQQGSGPQEASLEQGMHAEKMAFSLKAVAATDAVPPETDKTSRPRTNRTSHTDVAKILDLDLSRTVKDKQVVTVESDIHILPVTESLRSIATESVPPQTTKTSRPRSSRTTHTDVTEILDLDPSKTVQEKQVLTMESDIHSLPVTASPRRITFSPGDIEQVELISGGSSITFQNADAVAQESSVVLRTNTVLGQIPSCTSASESSSTVVDALPSLRTTLVYSKVLPASNSSILESNGDMSQNLVPEIVGIPEEHSLSSKKVVLVPSVFPKPIENGSANNVSLMIADSQTKHKPLGDTIELFPQKAADSAVRKTGEIQEGSVNSCGDTKQGSEMPKLASLDKPGLPSSCSAELKSQFSCMEQELQFLQRSIAEVLGDAEKLREQLQQEHQLVETEMEDLRKQLGSSISHLENLKSENICIQSCIIKA